jgi:hypothetical protein
MIYALPVHMAIMDGKLDQVSRNAVAAYRLRLGEILRGTDISLSNPFPLYWPGMPAYDAARKAKG